MEMADSGEKRNEIQCLPNNDPRDPDCLRENSRGSTNLIVTHSLKRLDEREREREQRVKENFYS